ncbi:MAG: arginine N-succinyltransferase [Acidiferrobacterales bacterium]
MIVIRPSTLDDLDALIGLGAEAGAGMTNLPRERELLEAKIQASIDGFAREIGDSDKPGEESYLFMMEDSSAGKVVGCCGIIATVGLSRPFYSYRLVRLPHTSRELKRYDTLTVLQMVNEYRGAAEIGTLYLTPTYRKNGNGSFLSRSRFLFMAEFPQRFPELIMAEMRGMQDEQGRCVFWESVGRHFLDIDFSYADYLSAVGKYQFIADLMPKHPIYLRLLPKAARDVIGVPHEATRPALKLLEREGFRHEGCVDVFDAGPTIQCPLSEIHTVRESTRVAIHRIVKAVDSEDFIIANTQLENFRMCRGNLRMQNNGKASIPRNVADALMLEVGDHLRFVKA